MKKLILFMVLCFPIIASAQLTEQGHVFYERKTNVHRQMEGNEWFEQFKNQVPKFMVTNHELFFTPEKTYYKPGKQPERTSRSFFDEAPVAENQVYTDLVTKKTTAYKPIFEQKFLVIDSQRQLRWKIGQEVRTIAGFKCRKAVGTICDTVYIVAFYCEDIPSSGGPESFGGLPGLILELAIPRLYTTWIAQKVDVGALKPEDFTIPEKGKKVNQKELYEALSNSMKGWGEWASRNTWWSII